MKQSKTILLTGATSGVGLDIAKQLLEQYEHVIVTGRNVDVLDQLRSLGAKTIVADLTKKTDRQSLVDQLPICLDAVIFSAGIGFFDYAVDAREEEINQTFDVNVLSIMQLMPSFVSKLKQSQRGHLVFLASAAGKIPTPKASIYAASKHALLGYANGLRQELRDDGIYVTSINPGPIRTPFLQKADRTGTYEKSVSSVMLEPVEVAKKVVQVLWHNKREVNMPFLMTGIAKLYMCMPAFIEWIGRPFFNKK